MFRFFFILLLFVCLAAGLPASEPENLYIAATNVRIRTLPSTSAEVVATLTLGTRGKILEKSAEKQALMGKNDYWYKIVTDDQKTGWVFGGLVKPFVAAESNAKAIELINSRLALKDIKVEEAVQVYDFARRFKDLVPHSEEKARSELAFLDSIEAVLDALAMSENQVGAPHKVISDNESLVYKHECAGRYFVEPDACWKLSQKYVEFPSAADDIAWVSATKTQQGETEGDPEAMLSFFDNSYSAYLEHFPLGKHADKALERGSELFAYVAESITPAYFGFDGSAGREKFIKRLDGYAKTAMTCQDSPARKDYLEGIATIRLKIAD